jgi:hypothetical protein
MLCEGFGVNCSLLTHTLKAGAAMHVKRCQLVKVLLLTEWMKDKGKGKHCVPISLILSSGRVFVFVGRCREQPFTASDV